MEKESRAIGGLSPKWNSKGKLDRPTQVIGVQRKWRWRTTGGEMEKESQGKWSNHNADIPCEREAPFSSSLQDGRTMHDQICVTMGNFFSLYDVTEGKKENQTIIRPYLERKDWAEVERGSSWLYRQKIGGKEGDVWLLCERECVIIIRWGDNQKGLFPLEEQREKRPATRWRHGPRWLHDYQFSTSGLFSVSVSHSHSAISFPLNKETKKNCTHKTHRRE